MAESAVVKSKAKENNPNTVVNWEVCSTEDDINRLFLPQIEYEFMNADFNQVMRNFYKLHAVKERGPYAFYFKDQKEKLIKIKHLLSKTTLESFQRNGEVLARDVAYCLMCSPYSSAKHIILLAINDHTKIPLIREIFSRILAFLELRDSESNELILISLYKRLLASDKEFDRNKRALNSLSSIILLLSQSKYKKAGELFPRTYIHEPLVSAAELLGKFIIEGLENNSNHNFFVPLLNQVLDISEDGQYITECSIAWKPSDETTTVCMDPKELVTSLVKLHMQHIDNNGAIMLQSINRLASKLQRDKILFDNLDFLIDALQTSSWNEKYCLYRWFFGVLKSEVKFEIPAILYDLALKNPAQEPFKDKLCPMVANKFGDSINELIKFLFEIGFVCAENALEFLQNGLPFQATGSISELIGHSILGAITPLVTEKALDRTKPLVERLIACLETKSEKTFLDECNAQLYNGVKDMSFLLALAEAFALYLKNLRIDVGSSEAIELDHIGITLLRSFYNDAYIFVNSNWMRLKDKDVSYSMWDFGANQMEITAFLNQLYILSTITRDLVSALKGKTTPRLLQELNKHVVESIDALRNKLFPAELLDSLNPMLQDSRKSRYGEFDARKLKEQHRAKTTTDIAKDSHSSNINANDFQEGSLRTNGFATRDVYFDEFDDEFFGLGFKAEDQLTKKPAKPKVRLQRDTNIRVGVKVNNYIKEINGK